MLVDVADSMDVDGVLLLPPLSVARLPEHLRIYDSRRHDRETLEMPFTLHPLCNRSRHLNTYPDGAAQKFSITSHENLLECPRSSPRSRERSNRILPQRTMMLHEVSGMTEYRTRSTMIWLLLEEMVSRRVRG